MMHADTTRTGAAFVAKRAQDNPRELVITLVEENPGVSKDNLFAKFREQIEESPAYRRAVEWYFFVNMYEYLVTSRNRKPAPRQSPADVSREVAALKQRVTEVILLNLVLPNGKILRDATGAECAQAGGWFVAIAKQVGPDQIVGAVLSEDQLRAMRK